MREAVVPQHLLNRGLGTSAPVPSTGKRSSKDMVKERVALQARIALHLRSHAARTRPCRISGSDCAQALATAHNDSAVSEPSTGTLSTTNRARSHQRVPDKCVPVSGLVECTAPSWLAALLLAVLSRLEGDTKVVSMAS